MRIRNAVFISDTHAGCQLGLYPCDGTAPRLDEGGRYMPSKPQRVLWRWWREFCDEWLPRVTDGEPFYLIHNGDALDGNHHQATHQITHNLADQAKIARAVLAPLVARAVRYYHVRGTEAHVGPSGAEEERLAESLGAVPNELEQHARYDLWLDLRGHLIHAMHHIGTTGSTAYEATAVHKELAEEFVESARWGERPPAAIVRSHRHRHIEIRVPTARGDAISVVTPAWQLKTPFAWRVPGARLAPPQIGGVLLRVADDGTLYTQPFVRTVGRSAVER